MDLYILANTEWQNSSHN